MTLRALVTRLLAVRRRAAIDAELAEEIEEHLRLAVEAKMAGGMSPDDAYRAARREFGNPTLVRESSRDTWAWPALEALVADLRFGLRIARKHRASTLVAIGSLGIATGITTGVLSLLASVMSPAYPFADSGRLAMLWARNTRTTRFDQMQVSMPELRRWGHDATQTSVAGFAWSQSVNVSTAVPGAVPTRSSASMVTSNLLGVLGVAPVIGRGFSAEDERADAPNAAIVTYDFWKESLGGSAAALSTPLVIDREPYAVIGVMPPEFRLPLLLKVKVLLPARRAPLLADRSARTMVAIGRLAPHATIASVSDELTRITDRFHEDIPGDRSAWDVNVQPLREVSRAYATKTLGILLALAILVLLVAGANVGILLLARVPARRHELAVRLALGAARRRIVLQLFAESGWLALGAAAVGAAVVPPTTAVLHRLLEGALAFELPATTNASVFAGLLLLTTTTCLGFGVAPALAAVRSLRDSSMLIGTRTAGWIAHESLRSVLMAAEVALSIMLVIGGWLMIETVILVHGRDLGFDRRQLVTARIVLDTSRYRSGPAQRDFYDALATRLRAHGELHDVTVGSTVPLGVGGDFANYTTRDGIGADDKVDTLTASASVVMPNYFAAMGIPVVAGRMFDGTEDEPVVTINETLARQLWPGRSAINERLRVLAPMYADGETVTSGMRRVVAVTRNIRYSPTNTQGHWPNFYLPHSQHPVRGMFVAVRAPTSAAGAAAIRAEVASLDPLLSVFGVKSFDELLDYWLGGVHLNAVIVDVLAGIGALLTLVGIYSVVAVFVSQRTHEIGVRIAIGAQRGDVVRMVLRRTLRPAALGIVVGSIAAVAGTRVMTGLLYGVSPLEPRAFVGAATLLLLVVGAAAAIPAARAARLDPLTALQSD